MGKRTKILATVMAATMLFAGSLVGCGGKSDSGSVLMVQEKNLQYGHI